MEFTQKFPEWVLSYSLSRSLKDCSIRQRFWQEADVRRTGAPSARAHFSELFEVTSAPVCKTEKGFAQQDAPRYGLEIESFRRTFLGLRPDFRFETDDNALLVLLEAKGGDRPKIGRPPKELPYFNFLKAASAIKKGLFYVVPKVYGPECAGILQEFFAGDPSVETGVIFWEALLPYIADQILRVSINEVAKITDGLTQLREWEEKHVATASA